MANKNFDNSAEPLDDRTEFDAQASEADPGIVREFTQFLRYNKKWWLTPILAIVVLLVGLAFLTASPAAPFIYSLF